MFVMIFLVVALSNMAFPWWTINRSDSAFEKSAEKNAASSLESYVVAGAGYFLDSYAHTLLFMRKLELGGENSTADPVTIQLLDSALSSIKQANLAYIQLKRLADTTPYHLPVIDALQKFDYENFCTLYGIEDKNFSRAREYLSKGDIRSIYGIMVNDTDRICRLLLQVKNQANAGTFPSTWDVWKLDQAYSGTERFGQYVSRIFDAVTAAGTIY
jgi:hypothetical protein